MSLSSTYFLLAFRLISENSKRKFRHGLKRSNVSFSQQNTAAEDYSNFNQAFNTLYDKYFPILTKTVTHKDEVKPWINDILINQMKIRDKLYKLAIRNRIDFKIYKDFRNLLTNHIRKAKAKYYEDEFKKTSSNIKKTWSTIIVWTLMFVSKRWGYIVFLFFYLFSSIPKKNNFIGSEI